MYHNTEHNTPYVGHEYPPQHVSHTEHQNDHYKSPRYENDFLVRSYASSIVSSVGERSGRNVRSISPKSSSVARRNYGGGSRRSRRRSISESHEHRTHLNRNHDAHSSYRAHSSHRAHSTKSHQKNKQNSSVSSKISLYVEQKAKLAALKAEAKFLHESHHVKGTDEWELGKEIAKAEAVADVYAQEEGRTETTNNNITHTNTCKGQKHSSQENGPGTGSRHVEESITKLLQLQTAPTVDMDEFEGDPLEFNYFLATFREVVEQNIDNPMGRLTRLIQYTKGEAKELIKNCIQENPSVGYTHAMSLLKTQYGNPHIIARAYIQELRNWETLKVGDSKAFRKFYGFLIKCKTCMTSGRYLAELNFPDILQVLQSKLPYGMQDKWNRRAVKLRTSGREADFNDFLNIVETETMVANDPMYSREALNHANNDTSTKSNNNNNNNSKKKTKVKKLAISQLA